MQSISKPNVRFSDDQLFSFAKATQNYMDGLKGLSGYEYAFGKVYRDRDFRLFDARYVYKFVTEQTYSKFIVNGSFLLGSLTRYRAFEEQGDPAGDRFEGSSFCSYTVGNRELTVATLSGFDTFIFSVARDLVNAEEMKAKFGPVILQIELKPFVRELAQAIDHESPDVRLVNYADLKMHRASLPLEAVTGFPPNLTPKLAQALRRRGRLPAIFGKPKRFETEREVRIAFEMSKDVSETRSVVNQRLLRHVVRLS